jgi:hypothetical protein
MLATAVVLAAAENDPPHRQLATERFEGSPELNHPLGLYFPAPEDLAQVPIEDKPDVRLSDVAEVVKGHQLLIGDAVINKGPSLLLVVEKFPGENTLDVTRAVEDKLEELSPGLSGIEIDPPSTGRRPRLTGSTILLAVVIGLIRGSSSACSRLIGGSGSAVLRSQPAATVAQPTKTFNIMPLADWWSPNTSWTTP